MSDERLRELERRWRATGASGDEAAWLRARIQTGGLAAKRVELAARLGDAAATLAAGLVDPLAWSRRADLEVALAPGAVSPPWAMSLQLHAGREGLLRFVLAALRGGVARVPWLLDGAEWTVALPDDPSFDWAEVEADEHVHPHDRGLARLLLAPDGSPVAAAGCRTLLECLVDDQALARGLAVARREVADWLLERGDALRLRVEEFRRLGE